MPGKASGAANHEVEGDMPDFNSRQALIGLIAGGILVAAPFAAAQDSTNAADNSAEEEAVLPDILANGLTITDSGGMAQHVSFTADGNYLADGEEAGSWTFQNGYLCLAMSTGTVSCTSVPEDSEAGSSWTTANMDGSSTTYEIPVPNTETETPDGEGDEG